MIDMESKITECLRSDAERVGQVDGLRERALARANTIRRRRRALGAAAGTGLAAALVASAALAVQLLPVGPVPDPTTGVSSPAVASPLPRPTPTGPTTLPEVRGAPTAAAEPSAVGTDGAIIHFDVNLAAFDSGLVGVSEWETAHTYEKVVLRPGNRDSFERATVEIYLGTDAGRMGQKRTQPTEWGTLPDGTERPVQEGPGVPMLIGGRPGMMDKVVLVGQESAPPLGWVLRWQPVDGLNALIQTRGPDLDRAFMAVGALRLDRAQRCSSPVRFPGGPAGGTVTKCAAAIRRTPLAGRGVWVYTYVTVSYPLFNVELGTRDPQIPEHLYDASRFKPNRTIAGWPAMWRDDEIERLLWVPRFGAVSFGISGLNEADSIRMAASLTFADPARPQTWPEHPIG